MSEMEEEAANPNQQISDPALEKKHQMMIERLSNRHRTRLENCHSDSSNSSTSDFLYRFNELKESITSQLSTADSSHLADISSLISNLEKLVAENSYLLPSYEVRSSLKTILDLKQNLENVTSQLRPKKKFSFKNKQTKKETQPQIQKPQSDNVSLTEKTKIPGFLVPDSPGFRNKENQVLVRKFKDSESGEFTLSDLNSCEVKLIGCVNALFINRLKNCRIYVGPVMGSILIEEVENCILILASHQIRIHFAKSSDFYLRVRSRPIIEDSNEVRFAPYCLKYEGIEEDLNVAGLNEETGNWANVDDFKWLRAVQSPNWRILPEEERIQTVDLADL